MLNKTEPIRAINKSTKKLGKVKESFSGIANCLESQHSPEMGKIPF